MTTLEYMNDREFLIAMFVSNRLLVMVILSVLLLPRTSITDV